MSARFARPSACVLAISTQLILVTNYAQAHPGHGLLDHGARHAITSPYHVGVLAVVGAGCWLAGRFVMRSNLAKRLLQCAGAMALIAAAALWTLGQ